MTGTRSDSLILDELSGGVCATPGIRASGVGAGLKPSGRLDLALVAASRPVPAAAVQTRNQVVAAPVEVTSRHLADGRAQAVLLNAGHANACTGPDGLALAEESAAAVAASLGCQASDVALCSTGVIGVSPPRAPLLAGVAQAVAALSVDGGSRAAKAIMTTDTVPKQAAVRVAEGDAGCVVGGMAKGSGMIAPALATMLCVLTTDAPLQGPVLRSALRDVAARTFGRVSVDACLSTNDAVVLMATGGAERPPSLSAFRAGLHAVCARLAEALVRDGEGAAKLIRLRVTGAPTEADAEGVARAVAGSALVRAAVAGGDPNWGRVLAAAGAGPVRFDPQRVAVSFGGVTVCRFGVVTAFDRGQAAVALRGPQVRITVDLGLGHAEVEFLTCDLTREYVTINAEYTT
ncbi:MAG TPA: bifunctional glutamate N-acetyltransferase/amino-acid acetyltransferase ArgJ [Egibacteraceae bacterium]|nr:bifunctional glutamate N-acetyltransferase/amino-acid acetyltransferase ArgJ [Egibacteraceae bacterium]